MKETNILLQEHSNVLAQQKSNTTKLSTKLELLQQNYPKIIIDPYLSPIKKDIESRSKSQESKKLEHHSI